MKIALILLSFTVAIKLFAQPGWQYQNSNLSNNEYGAICAINKDTVFVIAGKGKFLKTVNGGIIWTTHNTGITVSFFDLSFINADTGYAVGQKGTILRTMDGGAHWDSLTSGTNKDLFSVSTKTPNNIWAVGDSGVILNSHDYGTTWIKNNALTGKKLNSIRFRNSNIGFIAGNTGTLFGTVNGGANWNTLTIATTNDLFSLTVTEKYVYLFAGGAGGGGFQANAIFKTNDGVTWTSIMPGFSYGTASLFFQNDSLGFFSASGCTTNGACFITIAKTTNYGQNWIPSLTSTPPAMPGFAYSDIVFVTDKIGYVLCGNNILKTTDGGIFVNVKELEEHDGLKIYPNPATKMLTIDGKQFTKGNTYAVIYDMMGKQIKNERINISQTTEIDVGILSEGVYFIKVYTEDGLVGIKKFLKEK